ncbi:FKBP-type peptidyl-prolyl cis-trans isomerase [Patescibacteria group bacterium]|nr:FKBP-type peptidyl-prolyl cis-trans isomerase [Patescibacteria group bacterium]
MKPTQTGIVTALALTVIVVFFAFPGLSPFNQPQTQSQTAAADQAQDLSTNPQAQPAATTSVTMPTDTPKITQLMMKDEVVGTGSAAAAGDTVTVNYVGALTNGTVFDASAKHGSDGFTFTLGAGQVIKGWDQGIVGMKVGGKRMLAIPSALAYGSQAVGNVIPANSDLIFEVELLKVVKGAK